ncbi:MAG TPA: FecR domain-containing protein [Bacteroidales bacterium]|nr:FecR domain-containing protein [Bacteroidales bacterium]
MMEEKNHNIWEIITAILNGNASMEETALLNSWLNESEVNKKTYDLILNTSIREKEPSHKVKLKVFSQVQKELMRGKYIRTMRFWRYCAAASIAGLMLLSYFYIKESASSSEIYVETRCPNGNKSQIQLSDGTWIYLNSGSSIRYPERFKGDFRRVILKGEAYFNVEKDPKHPFIVETSEVKIKVLGTQFNVKNYDEEDIIETTLIEGAVQLSKKTDDNFINAMNLAPNQQAIYSKQTGELEKIPVDAELSTIWKEGKYYFEKESFASIVKKLERNFNVNIKINSPSLNKKVFSGLIDKNRNIFQTLDIMKRYSHFNYALSNDTIIITTNL